MSETEISILESASEIVSRFENITCPQCCSLAREGQPLRSELSDNEDTDMHNPHTLAGVSRLLQHLESQHEKSVAYNVDK